MAARTTPTEGDPAAFVAAMDDPARRADAAALLALMGEETGEAPRMWGPSIVGFGTYRMTYADGRQADWLAIGFSPRKTSLVLYLMDGAEEHGEALARLGPHSTGKACLYVKRLADVDEAVLRELVRESYRARTAG